MLSGQVGPFGKAAGLLSCAAMKAFFLLILLSFAVAMGAGMVGRERNREAVEKRLMASVESSGIIVGEAGGIAVWFDHFTGVVTGKVGSEEEKRTILARLSESVGAGRFEDRLVISDPEPVAVMAPRLPVALVAQASFRLEKVGDLVLLLGGVVPSAEIKSGFFAAAQRVAPEFFIVEDRIQVDEAVGSAGWIAGAPDLVSRLVGSVQEPRLLIDGKTATIGGSSDDRDALKALSGEFSVLFSAFSTRQDLLVYNEAKPSPVTRLPLVFYMGPWEGKVLFEGSIPTSPQLKEILSTATTVHSAEKVSSRLRVSPQTVNEPWLYSLPAIVTALLEGAGDKAELVIVDGSITLSGVVPDKGKREAILALLEPIRTAGYRVVVELKEKP
jgi:hypothetical protein